MINERQKNQEQIMIHKRQKGTREDDDSDDSGIVTTLSVCESHEFSINHQCNLEDPLINILL